jgi:Asp/Glu/hydantoin racemase
MEQQQSNLAIISEMPNTTKAITDTLLDSLKKLKEDVTYIKQATAINNTVNSLVKVAKLNMAYVKMMQEAERPEPALPTSQPA